MMIKDFVTLYSEYELQSCDRGQIAKDLPDPIHSPGQNENRPVNYCGNISE